MIETRYTRAEDPIDAIDKVFVPNLEATDSEWDFDLDIERVEILKDGEWKIITFPKDDMNLLRKSLKARLDAKTDFGKSFLELRKEEIKNREKISLIEVIESEFNNLFKEAYK